MGKRKDSRKSARKKAKTEQAVNGETLRGAVGWAVDARIFTSLKFHGNTKWQVLDLIVLTVVWVWSASPQLTGAFVEASVGTSGGDNLSGAAWGLGDMDAATAAAALGSSARVDARVWR